MDKILLLFDIDGTLLLSGGAGNRALNRVFQDKYGTTGVMQSITPDGKTDPAIIREIFQKKFFRDPSPEEIDFLGQKYLDYLQEELPISDGYHVLDGVVELLREIEQRSDILMGLLTGNLEQGARIKLARADLNRFFHFGGFGSDSEDRGEVAKLAVLRGQQYAGQPIPARRIFAIGDTAHDINCARIAGIKVIAVATGSVTMEELTRHQPDALLKNLCCPDQFWSAIFS